ncbi:MAG: penicillin-binding protein activator, partial [bacterium]
MPFHEHITRSMFRKSRFHERLYLTAATLAILALFTGCVNVAVLPSQQAPKPAKVPAYPLSADQEREQLMAYQEAVRLFREEGKAKQAFEMLKAFGRMHPESPYADDALLELSRIQTHLGKGKKAVSTLRNLLQKFPSSPLRKRAFIELGTILSDQGKYRNSNEALESIMSLDPLPEEKFEVLRLKSQNLAKMGNRVEAVWTAIGAYRWAETGIIREKARLAVIEAAETLKDRELEEILANSDGSAPLGVVAMTSVERAIAEGFYDEAMNELMGLLIDYPDQVSRIRIDTAFVLLKSRLLVKSNTVGAILPLSGRYAVYGEKALQGIQAAFGILSPLSDTNSELAFNLIVKDSGADPLKASQAVRDLSETEQVLAIIGPLFSRTTRAAAEAAVELGTPLISLSADPAIPEMGDNIFRRSLTDSQQVKALAELVYSRLAMRRFAFLYPDNAYGRGLMNLFWDELDKRGAVVVAAESFPPEQTDFGPQIRAIVGLNRPLTEDQLILKEAGQKIELKPIIDFDALFIPADFQTVGLLAPQLAFYDVTEALVLGADGWNSPWVVELGEHYVEG